MYFQYSEAEIDYLKAKDPRLAEIIDRIGPIRRPVDPDLFSSVVHNIVGQQISSKAQQSIWRRLQESLGSVQPHLIAHTETTELKALGLSLRKAEYIKEFAEKVLRGSFDLKAVYQLPDAEAISALSSLKGVGVWTAEMILLFCLQRRDIFSYGDMAILRGLRLVYRHRAISRKLFEKYRRRLSPCCSVASLYFWEVAGGAIPELQDSAPQRRPPKKSSRHKAGEALIYEILSVVEEIPEGKVASYGQIARLIGRDKNARLVGAVLSRAERYGDYPCHRVLNHAGRLAPFFREQKDLLIAEGLEFKANGCVDMKKYQWNC